MAMNADARAIKRARPREMPAVKPGFADPKPADDATRYQRLKQLGHPKLLQDPLTGPRLVRRRFDEATQACTRSRRKECISCSPAMAKMITPTGMYAVQKSEQNMPSPYECWRAEAAGTGPAASSSRRWA